MDNSAERPDLELASIAARQLSAFTRWQAEACGLTKHQCEHRVRTRRWQIKANVRGVYVLAGSAALPGQDAMVACLAGPEGTVASHLSAAALYGLLPHPATVHVTAPPGSTNCGPHLIVHRALLDARDTATASDVPATKPARTLVDLATVLDPDRYAEVVDAAIVRKLVRVEQIRAALDRRSKGRGRTGAPLVRATLEAWSSGIDFGSVMEAKLHRRLRSWGLPMPEGQHQVVDAAGRKVARLDFGWPERRVCLEYLGELPHVPRREPHDEARTAALEALGWVVEEADKADLRPGATRLFTRLQRLLR